MNRSPAGGPAFAQLRGSAVPAQILVMPRHSEPVTPPTPIATVADTPADAAGADAERRHPTDRAPAVVILLACILCLMALWALTFTRGIAIPIAMATALAMVLTPPVRYASRFGVPEPVGALMAIIGLVGVLLLGGVAAAGPAQDWAQRLPEIIAGLEQRFRDVRESVAQVEQLSDQVGEMVSGDANPEPGVFAVTVRESSGLARLFVVSGGGLIGGVVLALTLAYFMLAFGDLLLRNLVHIVPRFRDKVQTVAIVRGVQHEIAVYFGTISLINVGLGVATGVAMWLLGMPNPILWGIMAAVLNYIPYLGALVGTVVIALVASAEHHGLAPVLWTAGAYYALTAIEGTLVTPLILGKRMRVNPLIIVLALVFWGWLWGLAGVFLAVPLLIAVKVACERVERLEPVGALLAR
ncbi:MAG: AI-2E family transporter [Phycisphaerales bacterium]